MSTAAAAVSMSVSAHKTSINAACKPWFCFTNNELGPSLMQV